MSCRNKQNWSAEQKQKDIQREKKVSQGSSEIRESRWPNAQKNQKRPDLWDQTFQKQAEKIVIGKNVGELVFFPLGCCFGLLRVLRYEAATVSVTFTSQVAQRPSFHGVSVRPSGRLPSALKRPCGSLTEGNPALESEYHMHNMYYYYYYYYTCLISVHNWTHCLSWS